MDCNLNICHEIKTKIHTNTIQHYTVIFLSGNIKKISLKDKLSLGVNSDRSFHNMPSSHSEVMALNAIKHYKNLPRKLDILVIRFNKYGEIRQSRPCLHCLKYMNHYCQKYKFNINNVYYSTSQDSIIKEKFNDLLKSKHQHICFGMRKKLGLI